jgi:hypothetical protein
MDEIDESREAFSLRGWLIGGMVLGAVVFSIIIRVRTGEWDVGKMLGFGIFILTMLLLWWISPAGSAANAKPGQAPEISAAHRTVSIPNTKMSWPKLYSITFL